MKEKNKNDILLKKQENDNCKKNKIRRRKISIANNLIKLGISEDDIIKSTKLTKEELKNLK